MGSMISIGKSAMFASYAALHTTSNNISNANTAGYSRQEAQLADAPGQFTGNGFFGRGVEVRTVARAYDAYLSNQAVQTASTAAADAARRDKLTQLENIFPIGSEGIGQAAGDLMNAFVDVSNNPGDSSSRQVVLSEAQQFAARVRAAGEQLSALQAGVVDDMKTQVAGVNEMARQVAGLNAQIAGLRGASQTPNQLLDQRDQLVKQIGQIVNVTTVKAEDGSVGLFIGGGQSLVLGTSVRTIGVSQDTFDPQKAMLTLDAGGTAVAIPTDSLNGGSIAGLVRFQAEDLATAKNLLGQLATGVSGAVNRQQSLGLDLGQPAGIGAPIFATGAARVQPASTNHGTAALTLAIADTTKVQPSDYVLAFDGTAWNATRSSDRTTAAGSPFTAAQMSAGVSFDGITVRIASGSASAGDRFQLQPVAGAAEDTKVVLDSPNGIAAASPFVGTVGVNNTGTATIASLVAANTGYNGALTANLTFTNATGAYSWSLSNGSSGTGQWTAGSPILLNGFSLALNGVPRNGDTLAVAPTVSVASNNGNALGFVDLGAAKIVAGAGIASSAGGQSATDAYAAAIANIGVRIQGGKTSATISAAAASTAEAARSDRSGVNLDEEAARLIQYQQSYQAAAKILKVAQQMFDTMLQMAG